jgi:hypothetical protein
VAPLTLDATAVAFFAEEMRQRGASGGDKAERGAGEMRKKRRGTVDIFFTRVPWAGTPIMSWCISIKWPQILKKPSRGILHWEMSFIESTLN